MTAKHALKRQLARLARWLHIYGSMLSFALVLFFSVTGITLNHPDWFASAERRRQLTGQVDARWLAQPLPADGQLRVVEHLRTAHGLRGAVSDFRIDDREASVAFKGPGYSADAFIVVATGRYEVTETRLGAVAVLNDLHKGRDSGAAWSWLIDVAAALLLFVSATGLVLLYYIHKHRLAGAVLLVVGGGTSWLLYALLVP